MPGRETAKMRPSEDLRIRTVVVRALRSTPVKRRVERQKAAQTSSVAARHTTVESPGPRRDTPFASRALEPNSR
ncbi:hypothetical protein GCM10020369_77360 [Cryptosporangium minutisporangium]|uniref:Uncharacterized protein n=1 Tax=Cryptosporangium minutisporangium TaxID=113569 RepID=A0ABP6TBW5_9ACTN